jgi:hypothetical protein
MTSGDAADNSGDAQASLDIPDFLRRGEVKVTHVALVETAPDPNGTILTDRALPTVGELYDTITRLRAKQVTIREETQLKLAEIDDHVRILKKQAEKMVRGL